MSYDYLKLKKKHAKDFSSLILKMLETKNKHNNSQTKCIYSSKFGDENGDFIFLVLQYMMLHISLISI